MEKCQIGLWGLGTMGENLAFNMADKGFTVAVYNRTVERTKRLEQKLTPGSKIKPTYSLDELIASLESPHRILIMVTAGPGVDDVIRQLSPMLLKGDMLIDGGNAFFKDTERRAEEVSRSGIRYMGVGVSGGEEGARKGPCIMAGGSKDGYELLRPVFEKVAAQIKDGACAAYLGGGGAGHFTKMVHNGIEYAVLQLISEAYDIQASGLGLPVEDVKRNFGRWNDGPLGSYLMEITASVLERKDEESGLPLVELILDRAGQKGTGMWASQTAMELGVPTPTIDAAVATRNLSALLEERTLASKVLRGPGHPGHEVPQSLLEALGDATFCSVIVSYAQGLALLKNASERYGYGMDLSTVARIWRGGCIIRAKLLEEVQDAFRADAKLKNLLLDGKFASKLADMQQGWRLVIQFAKSVGIPCPAMSSALDYYDLYRRSRLPTSLIQALRDYFGAHTYERIDKPGIFHTRWNP